MMRSPARPLRRGVVAVALALAVVVGTVEPAEAHTRTVTTGVDVQVHHDGQHRGRSTLRIAHTFSSDVTAVNRAHAYARCEDCGAVALSFQIVIANRGPANIAADNAAVAVNDRCVRCETAAVAYQFVVAGPGRSYLSPAGHVRLARVRVQLQQLAWSGQPAEEIGAQAQVLAAEVASVLTSELGTFPAIHRHFRHHHGRA